MPEVIVDDPDFRLYRGEAREVLRGLPEASVDCVVTSPPYWSLRSYPIAPSRWEDGWEGQLGAEPTPEGYVAHLVEVLREARRALAPHGTLWLNLGDSFASGNRAWREEDAGGPGGRGNGWRPETPPGRKQKDLIGVPWLAAFALQRDGWWLRRDVVWDKSNSMPESVRDRPSSAHEYLFALTGEGSGWHEYVYLLAPSERYYYDRLGETETAEWARWGRQTVPKHEGTATATGWMRGASAEELGANVARPKGLRSVWRFPTRPFSARDLGLPDDEHYAAFPEELPRRCLLLGCPREVCEACGRPRERIVEKKATGRVRERAAGGLGAEHRRESHGLAAVGGQFQEGVEYATVGWSDCGCGAQFRAGRVLDPFLGTGTTALAARRLGLTSVGVEQSEGYCRVAERRVERVGPFWQQELVP